MKRLFHIPERKFLACLCGSGFILGVLTLCHDPATAASVAICTLGTLWGGLFVVQHRGEQAERRDKDGEKH
jgi:hypothetical protein